MNVWMDGGVYVWMYGRAVGWADEWMNVYMSVYDYMN